MRAAGRAKTPMADLSRGVVGVIGRSLVVNVPGSPKAALESLAALEPTLAHALETLAGPHDHGAAGPPGAASAAGAAGTGHNARPDFPDPDSADVPRDESGGDDEPWVPIPDENDEWRDLPGGRSS